MARGLHGVERGLRIFAENGATGIDVLRGSAVPGSAAQENNAEVGSIYIRSNGEFYQKDVAGSGTDKWVKTATVDDVAAINWRPELVRALTATAAPIEGGTVDASAFTDDDGSLSGSDFAVGEYIAFGSGGTEKLGEITNIATDTLTITYIGFGALSDNDGILVRKYLPDGAGQENSALVYYNGSDYVKLSDFDWSLATGINVSTGYAASSGDPAASDTVEKVLQNIDGNVDAVEDAVGVAQGATDMGAYTGSTVLTDSTSAKANIQELGTEAKALRDSLGNTGSDMGVYSGDIITDNSSQATINGELESAIENGIQYESNAVTTEVSLVEFNVDDILAVELDIHSALVSDRSDKDIIKIFVGHDGHVGADAANVDDTVFGKLKLGSGSGVSISADLSGTGVAQIMRIRISAAAAVDVNATLVGAIRQ